MRPRGSKVNPRKIDLLVIAGLLMAVALAAFVESRYHGFRPWVLVVVIVVLAYTIGIRQGTKRRPS